MKQTHEIISIERRVPLRTIRIDRDYSLGDGITRFSTEYPVQLSDRVKKKKA